MYCKCIYRDKGEGTKRVIGEREEQVSEIIFWASHLLMSSFIRMKMV